MKGLKVRTPPATPEGDVSMKYHVMSMILGEMSVSRHGRLLLYDCGHQGSWTARVGASTAFAILHYDHGAHGVNAKGFQMSQNTYQSHSRQERMR